MTLLPLFERLEDRIVLDAEPSVTITGPETLPLGAQGVDFTLTFDNDDVTGYGPYIDVIVPTAGPDGYDGVSIQGVDFLGTTPVTQTIVFDAMGEAEHPFAVDAFGNPIVVNGNEGDTLLIIELPYGSFSPGNPPIDVDLTLDFSNLTDLDQDFQLSAIPGFFLGEDQFDDPSTDAPIRGPQADFTQTQTLYTFEKTNSAPEDEHATGPSYIYTHTITLDIADGQTLDNIVITDTLPPEMVYQGNLRVNGVAATGTIEPTVGQPSTSAGPVNNQLEVAVGTGSGTVTVEFDYYIDQNNADTGTPVVPVASGDDQLVTNVAGLSADWTPVDTNDPPVAITDTAIDEYQAASLAIQKGNAVLTNVGPAAPTPGDVYTFTLNVQVSDYFTYGDLVVTDILGNGWDYVAGSAEFTTVEETGSITTAQDLTPFENSTFDGGTGETTNIWDISAAMAAQSGAFGSDGLLTGQLADGAASGSNTRVTITYQAEIRDQFSNDGNVNDLEISQGDVLSNSVSITGSNRDNDTPAT
ncbi:MAG: LEPR-XLL domain-containing protein, partial [Pseudomonadota bacterium]